MNLDQQKALARSRARMRAAEQGGSRPPPSVTGPAIANASETAPQPQVVERGNLLDPIVQGMTFGFGDEIAGGFGGAMDWLGGGSFDEGYERTAAHARGNLDAYRERQPLAAAAGEIGGAVASFPVTGALNVIRAPAAISKMAPLAARGLNAAARGAATTANAAATGAAYGGVYGAGTADEGGRLSGAFEGAKLGGALGAAAPAAIGIGKAVARGIGGAVGHPLKVLKGATMPQSEAAKRVAAAVEIDTLGQGGPAKAEQVLDAARRAGVPQTVLDVGETTRALGRSSANTSTEARALLNQMVDKRFESQGERAIDVITRNAPGVNSPQTRHLLEQAAKAANKPAYAQAYLEGEKGIWHEGLEQLTVAPMMQNAIRKATSSGANKAAIEGFRPPQNPFAKVSDGSLRLKPDVKPTLQFWDAVKRNLDDVIGTAQRSGANSAARDATAIKSQLVSYLDEAVPSYQRARQGAAAFFGADDALSAGEKFVTAKVGNAEARDAIGKMSRAEQQLFGEGFATQLINRIREVGDRRNIVIGQMFASPASRERIEIALGKPAADEMEAFLRLEDLMDLGRKAVQGNSTTARQLQELGLAGVQTGIAGGAGLFAGGGDIWNPTTLITAALTGVGLRKGRAMLQGVDTKIAREVASMLTSQDPKVFKLAVQRVSRNPKMIGALRKGHDWLTRALTPMLPREGSALSPLTAGGGPDSATADQRP